MAGTSGHTLEILVQARDAATAVLKGIDSVFKDMGASASDSAKKAGTALVDMSAQAKQLKVSIDEVASSLAGVGIAAAGFGATLSAGFGVAIKSASDFEAAVTGVRAVLQSDFAGNVTGLNTTMGQLADKARELGTTTQFSAVQAANAMEDLAKAGYKVNEIMASSDAVLKLAAASQMGLADTAEAVVNILTPFGLKAEAAAKTTNTLAVVANETTSGLRDITEAMKFAAPAAASLNLSVEETAAAIGVLADNGMKGTIAGTSLRGIFIDLVKPTKQAQEALKNMGVELVKNNDGSFNAIATFKRLRDAQMTLADSAAIFGVHQATAALALAKNVDKFGELTEKTRTQTTALDDLTKTVTGSFKVAVQRLIATLEVLNASIGEPLLAPLKAVVEQIIEGVKWLGDFARAHETLTKYVLGAIGAVGAIVTVFGAVSLALAGLLWALGSMRQAWITMIAVWERGIVLSLRAEAAAISEAAARERNAVAALREADAVGKANQAKGGASTGGIGATVSGALPGVGVAAGIGGAAVANLAKWDSDLKGINTTLLDISALASFMPGQFGAIGQAVTAWASALSFTVGHWAELTGFIKDDLGILGRLWVGMVDLMVAPFRAAYSAATGFLQAVGLMKRDIPDVTQAQKDFTRASVEMGESWAEFQKSYANTFGTRPPAEIARQFGQLRREAKGAGDTGKQAGTDIAAGMTEAAKATRLTATEQQELEKQSKSLASALKEAFNNAKIAIGDYFQTINDSIANYEKAWKDSAKNSGLTSVETQNAFKSFADNARTQLETLGKYINENFDRFGNRLKSAIQAEALKPEIEACKAIVKDFADMSLKDLENLSKGWQAGLRSTMDEIIKIDKELKDLEQKYQKQRVADEEAANNAIRNLRRSTLTDLAKFQEQLDVMQSRKNQADQLISQGGLDNLKQAHSLMRQNIQDAGQMRETSVTAWDQMGERAQAIATEELTFLTNKAIKTEADYKRIELINSLKTTQVDTLNKERAAEIGIQEVQEAQQRIEETNAKMAATEREEREAKKRDLQEQAGVFNDLIGKAKQYTDMLKQKLAITLDTSAAEEALKTLTRPREIDIKANITTTGDGAAGMATGGPLPGYGGGDIIPAYLEPGEFVVRKEAVSSVGVGLLSAINSLGGGVSSALRSVFSGLGVAHFQSGGLVSGVSERLADALNGLGGRIDSLLGAMSSAQQTIQQPAYAGQQYGGGSDAAIMSTFKDAVQQFSNAVSDASRMLTESQKVEVRVQDGIGSTQTSYIP